MLSALAEIGLFRNLADYHDIVDFFCEDGVNLAFTELCKALYGLWHVFCFKVAVIDD
jgi:hypothetical protein